MLFVLLSSVLWAEQYDIWELETKEIYNKFLSHDVSFDFAQRTEIIPINQPKQKNKDKDWEWIVVAGTISFYLKGEVIAQNRDIPQELGELYLKEAENKQAYEKDRPFLGDGKQYIFLHKNERKYYYCFIEWDERMTKWNQGKQTWDVRMFPAAMAFFDKIPRIYLAPLAHLGDELFLKEDIAVIIDGTSIPHSINKDAKKPKFPKE